MKKIALLLMILSVSLSYGQKKKQKSSKSADAVAKSGDAKVVYNKKKDLFLVVSKDSMLLAKNNSDFNPINIKITPVKIKANTFYCVTWNENVKTETKLKKDKIAITENQIWNPATKTLLIGNTQKAIETEEIVFLDKLKTASETQYKKRSEGYEFQLLPTGEFFLKMKNKSTKYAYNEKSSRYEVKK